MSLYFANASSNPILVGPSPVNKTVQNGNVRGITLPVNKNLRLTLFLILTGDWTLEPYNHLQNTLLTLGAEHLLSTVD